jgi:hypothetical protein
MRFLLPQGTSIEQQAVQSIWDLNVGALAPLTARYGNDTQLVGKMYRSVSGWSAWWVLSQGGAEITRWPVTIADPQQVIASGADGAADALAKRDTQRLNVGTPGVFAIDLFGIRTGEDFVRAMGYLQTLAVVRRVQVDVAEAGRLRLQLDLAVGLRGFNALIASGDTLRGEGLPEPPVVETSADAPLPPPPPPAGVPRYHLQPVVAASEP